MTTPEHLLRRHGHEPNETIESCHAQLERFTRLSDQQGDREALAQNGGRNMTVSDRQVLQNIVRADLSGPSDPFLFLVFVCCSAKGQVTFPPCTDVNKRRIAFTYLFAKIHQRFCGNLSRKSSRLLKQLVSQETVCTLNRHSQRVRLSVVPSPHRAFGGSDACQLYPDSIMLCANVNDMSRTWCDVRNQVVLMENL